MEKRLIFAPVMPLGLWLTQPDRGCCRTMVGYECGKPAASSYGPLPAGSKKIEGSAIVANLSQRRLQSTVLTSPAGDMAT